MRVAVIFTVLVGLAVPLHAQTVSPSACQPFSFPPNVIVKMHDGKTLRGTLLCLGDEVDLAVGGRVSKQPLSSIARISEPRDPVWDGAAKGAAIGLLIWAGCLGECSGSYILRTSASYALAGAAIDALIGNNKTVYRGGSPSTSLAWRVRF